MILSASSKFEHSINNGNVTRKMRLNLQKRGVNFTLGNLKLQNYYLKSFAL